MLALGTKQLPVIARGKKWVNGQSLKSIADLVGIDLGTVKHLPPEELVRRIDVVLDGSARFFAQFPEDHLGDQLPGRPRSYAQLAWHLFNVVDAFLEHENGIPLSTTAYNRVQEAGHDAPRDPGLRGRRQAALRRLVARRQSADRLDRQGQGLLRRRDRHEFLERTTWHSGQHSRQLMWVLEDKFAIAPDGPIDPSTWKACRCPRRSGTASYRGRVMFAPRTECASRSHFCSGLAVLERRLARCRPRPLQVHRLRTRNCGSETREA